jgi:hypothetical protein
MTACCTLTLWHMLRKSSQPVSQRSALVFRMRVLYACRYTGELPQLGHDAMLHSYTVVPVMQAYKTQHTYTFSTHQASSQNPYTLTLWYPVARLTQNSCLNVPRLCFECVLVCVQLRWGVAPAGP